MDEIRESIRSDRIARSWVEISLSNLEHNISTIRGMIPQKTEIIAVVKANAYGHGIDEIANRLNSLGIKSFGVADPNEALHLRKVLPESEITVFGGCQKNDEEIFRSARLTAAVFDLREVARDIRVQIKIDTGMGRLGVPWKDVDKLLPDIRGRVTGVYATMASADSDPDFTQTQIKRFLEATAQIRVRRHVCNSAGLRFAEGYLEAVRPGLALYGIAMVPELGDLLPVLEWKTRILALNNMEPRATLGYGSTFRTEKQSRIAVLPVGYADGYNRLLSNQGKVEINQKLYPVVGRVSMDLTLIDVTSAPEFRIGDEVKLISSDPESPISALAMAQQLNTIPYEVLTTIGTRVERICI